ncbi:isomerase [Streptomyces albus subsp. albus]|nr:isomerase [Streptomyces albus subsp. albus]
MSPRPRWYFSFNSPYSWLAYRDLMGPYADVGDRIDWFPFWDPDEPVHRHLARSGVRLPYVPISAEKKLYVEHDVRRLVRDRGMEVVWPKERVRRWEVPHLAFLVAQELGRGREFAGLVYQAYWQQARDVCDPEVIVAIGAELGLPADRLTAAARGGSAGRPELDALLVLHRDRVFGVPYFIDGTEKYWGVDRLAPFAALVRAAHGG